MIRLAVAIPCRSLCSLTVARPVLVRRAFFHGTTLCANRSGNGSERRTKTGRQRKAQKRNRLPISAGGVLGETSTFSIRGLMLMLQGVLVLTREPVAVRGRGVAFSQ